MDTLITMTAMTQYISVLLRSPEHLVRESEEERMAQTFVQVLMGTLRPAARATECHRMPQIHPASPASLLLPVPQGYKPGPAFIAQQQVGERTRHLVEGWYDLLGVRILHLEEDHLIAGL